MFFHGPLKSRCEPCHNRLTATYDGGFGNPRRERPPGAGAPDGGGGG